MKPAILADAVGEYLEGQRLASHFLARCRAEFIDPDDLHRQLEMARCASLERVRGFARRLSKEFERRPANATE